jgi:hypothetical protein
MKRLFFLSGLIILVLLAGVSLADIPKLINYQGMLTDNSGNPLTGTYDITFKIYNAPSGGDKRWEETQTNVGVTTGLFNVILGGATVGGIDLDFSEEYWLDVTVGGEQMGERLRFTSVGYAYRALVADSAVVAGSSAGGAGGWVDDGAAVRLQTSNDKVGIGTTSPGVKLQIAGGTDVKEGTQNSGYLILGPSTGSHIAIDNNEIMAKSSGTSVGNLYIQATTTEANTIIHGKVGIGTSTPNDDLHVANHIRVGEDPDYSNVYGELKHDGGGNGFKINAHAGGGGWADMHLQTNGGTKIFIESGGYVGIGTQMPKSKLDINGSLAMGLTEVYHSNSPYHLTDYNCIVAANAASGRIDVVLPPASSVYRRVYTVKKVDATSNWVYVFPHSGDTIEGITYIGTINQWWYVTVISNGFDWLILGKSW